MNPETRDLFQWIWNTPTYELERVCKNFDKKHNIKQRINFNKEGDMEV